MSIPSTDVTYQKSFQDFGAYLVLNCLVQNEKIFLICKFINNKT